MNNITVRNRIICLILVLVLMPFTFGACSAQSSSDTFKDSSSDTSGYIVSIDDEPDTVDFQCTTIYYTVAQNVFDRLVEMESGRSGTIKILPSLAKSWEVSEDGRKYTFHLRDNVKFSNGSDLTSSDVYYTFVRLLTYPDSSNKDIANNILGASKLESGETDQLEGIRIINDLDFSITLEKPFEAFLACLSMPGASILDEESTEAAGDLFGKDAEHTIGTGSFILEKWEPETGMLFKANPDCWAGAPLCEGVDLRFVDNTEDAKTMFENGTLDILDLDELDNSAEYFIHGDIYKDRLENVNQVGITYIALNQSVKPLDDVRVRKALQYATNRKVLLDTEYDGYGSVENGIFPHGLYGYDPDLPEIPYDPEEAVRLLKEAGYGNGLDLTMSVRSTQSQRYMQLAKLLASMWSKAGIRLSIDTMEESEFMELRKSGKLACYTASWIADYNDPDNFIYTFFGSKENSEFRSLCYPNETIMERVRDARTIQNPEKRIKEYRKLQKIIVQDDAAWIPLFSRKRLYMVSERLGGFNASWNGSVKNNYRDMSVRKAQ